LDQTVSCRAVDAFYAFMRDYNVEMTGSEKIEVDGE